jgi:cysteine-rich repeat protein
MTRGALLALTLAVSGCRLQTEGLSTEQPFAGDAFADETSTGTPDSTPVFPVEDAAPGECEGKPDGTPCSGANNICVASACIPSACGDGIRAMGEDCDDSNTTPGDGCPEDCKYRCAKDLDCDDGNVCSVDKCDLAQHVCAPKTPVTKGTECTLSSGEKGNCNGTACTLATCGDGTTISPEECDDGNTDDKDGCRSDCTFTCKTNADCADGTLCNGAETCNSSHVCVKGAAVVCNDSIPCTTNVCTASTGKCSYPLIDNDGDGFASRALGACGTDCHDRNPQVRPDQNSWFAASYTTPSGARSFDYNCDGAETRQFPAVGGCVKDGSNCNYRAGWIDSVPACGVSGTYVTGCNPSGCKENTTTGVQRCR